MLVDHSETGSDFDGNNYSMSAEPRGEQIYPGASWKSDIYLDCDGKGHTVGASSAVVNIFYAFWCASRHVMG